MHGKKVRAVALSGITQQVNVGPLPVTTPRVIDYYGGVVEMAAGSVIVTDQDGTVIDAISATSTTVGKSWLGPEGIVVNAPLTVTVTGTVAGSIYVG